MNKPIVYYPGNVTWVLYRAALSGEITVEQFLTVKNIIERDATKYIVDEKTGYLKIVNEEQADG